MRTLIENPKYRSFEDQDGTITLQHSGNFFNTCWSVDVKPNGTVEGDFEDKLEIVADCMEIPVGDVVKNLDPNGYETSETDHILPSTELQDALDNYLVAQAENDKEVAEEYA